MRTLSPGYTAAIEAGVQQPGLLVEAQFSSVQRWSSQGTVTWAGNTWQAQGMSADGLRVEALRISGTLVLDNRDGIAGSLILSQGVQDRVFRLWTFDAAATGTSDPVWLCDAVGSGAQVGEAQCAIALRHPCEYVFAPRTFVNSDAGFTQLLPAGAVLRINGIDYKLERRS